jgi:hypothetical protein
VYPWVRFLDRDTATALRVMQACRIRWGVVESVDGDAATMTSRPLRYTDGALALGDPRTDSVPWRRDGLSLMPTPMPGSFVAAHWDWICGPLSVEQSAALESATHETIDLVNGVLRRNRE